MKYIVEVNAKYLVSIEADSVLNAEHKLLDYNGIWGANAYDRKAMKTDTFAGAVQFDEMVSMNELVQMINETMDAKAAAVKAKAAQEENAATIEEMEKRLAELKKTQRELDNAAMDAMAEYRVCVEKLGEPRR